MVGRLIALLAALLAPVGLHAAILDETWIDPARGGRSVPVRLYLPQEPGPHPVVIFTPGLGQGRDSAAYLGSFWSAHGYLALFLQHPGTDSDLTPEQQKRAGLDGRALAARYLDLPFAITTLLKRANQPGALEGRVMPARLAVAGHSLGAVGAAIAVGRKTSAGNNLADPRLRAVILMSPTPGPGDAAANFSAVNVPALHLTGTEDRDESVPKEVSQRFKPFALIKARPQALVVFQGGDHLVFSATPAEVAANPSYRPIQASVQEISTKFLDAVLKDDADARAWMLEGGLANTLGRRARVEVAR
ncbi:MAG: alpha/beta hydrolase family protein [Elsteraceae bacterium]